jgi:hypothetical protein
MHEQIIARLQADMAQHRRSQQHWEDQVRSSQITADYHRAKAAELQRAIDTLKQSS